MNLKSITTTELVAKTKRLAHEEKRITLEILHHLREIQRRRTYAELGFSSLFEFATKHLGYSPGAAQRRIEGMRLLTELPEMESKVESGELQLSTLASAQGFFKAERKEQKRVYTHEEKKAVVEKLCGKSVREAERVFVSISPQHVTFKDRERPRDHDKIEFQFLGDAELKALLDRVKELMACPQDPNPTTAALLKKMAKAYLEKNDPLKKKTKAKPSSNITSKHTDPKTPAPEFGQAVGASTSNGVSTKGSHSRYVTAADNLALHQRANGQCEFIDPVTKRRCEGRSGLQAHHVNAYAKGGPTIKENLQLLCSSHNTLYAIRDFGEAKMQRYLSF